MDSQTRPNAAEAVAHTPATATRPKRPIAAYDEPTPEKIAFGKRMKEAREIAGLDQADAAQALGYSQQVQLSLMESGQRMPPARVLIQCAVLYGTTMDFLCGLVEDSDRDPAVVAQREVAQRVTADVRNLIATVTAGATDAVRQLRPDAGRTARLAGQVVELASALARLRERDGTAFDELHAGAMLVRRTAAALATAQEHLDAVARAQRHAARVPVDLEGLAGLQASDDLADLARRLTRPLHAVADGDLEAEVTTDTKEDAPTCPHNAA